MQKIALVIRPFHMHSLLILLGIMSCLISCNTSETKTIPVEEQIKQSLSSQNHDKALSILDSMLRVDSLHQDQWWHEKALALTKLQRYAEALNAINEAIDLNPGEPLYIKMRIRINYLYKDYFGAEKDLTCMLDKGYDSSLILTRADCYLHLDKIDSCFKDCKAYLIHKDSKNLRFVWYLMGTSYKKQNQIDSAYYYTNKAFQAGYPVPELELITVAHDYEMKQLQDSLIKTQRIQLKERMEQEFRRAKEKSKTPYE